MDEQGLIDRGAAAPLLERPAPACVFCGRPVAGDERCPLLPSSHWACCACRAEQGADHDAA
jgi:hypothetical protein